MNSRPLSQQFVNITQQQPVLEPRPPSNPANGDNMVVGDRSQTPGSQNSGALNLQTVPLSIPPLGPGQVAQPPVLSTMAQQTLVAGGQFSGPTTIGTPIAQQPFPGAINLTISNGKS